MKTVGSNALNVRFRATPIALFILLAFASPAHADTAISANITSDTTWSPSGGIYIIQNSITINPGKTLTIDPGTVVKFKPNAELTVSGTLNALGTAASSTYFTSIKDDIGGDTNGDGTSTAPAGGDWADIQITSGGTATFNQSVIKYGGDVYHASRADIYNNGGTLSVIDSRVSSSTDQGIRMASGITMITGTDISTGTYGYYQQSGIGSISGSHVHDNTYNLSVAAGTLAVVHTTFSGTGTTYIDGSVAFTHANNTASSTGGGTAGFVIAGNISSNTLWTNDTMPYVIGGLTIKSGATLSIDPGTIVKFQPNTELTVSGILNALGTTASPIYFTSIKDDTVGGDTNGDGTSTAPARGDWIDIQVGAGGAATFDHAILKYGGHTQYTSRADLYNNGGTLSVLNSRVSDSTDFGIRMANGTTTITGTDVTAMTYGYYQAAGTGIVSGSNLHDSTYNLNANAGTLSVSNTAFSGTDAAWIDAGVAFTHANNTASNTSGHVAGFIMIGNITSNREWTNDTMPYVINNSITINPGKMLTIDPGTIVKFQPSAQLYVNGTLNALGTATTPIYFTSLKDDAIGGDTNGDNTGTAPTGGDWVDITIVSGGTATLDHAVIRYGGNTQYTSRADLYNNGGTLSLTNSHISHASQFGIRAWSGTTTITGTEITGNLYGYYYAGGTSHFSGNNIRSNTYGMVNGTIATTTAKNNYWGGDKGPYNAKYNPTGNGDAVTDFIDFAPFLTSAPSPVEPPPPACTINCNSNILFLPGIEASRLYRPQVVGDPEQKLWEPGIHDDLHDLYLTPEGQSVRDDVYAKVGDVIDETPVGANIYKSFIEKMNVLKTTGNIADWESAPYDWRLSLDDILVHGKQAGTQISYLNATDTPYIIQELKRLASTSRTGKVTIIAHSNGGLVAKRLTEALGADASTLIDKMIFVASPQAGTPAALAALLHGHDQAIAHGIVVDEAAARTFASTSPMTYQLLPSARYFTQVDDPVVSFDASLPEWIARYGSTIHSRERLHDFLADSYGRVDAKTGDIDQPIQGNTTLLSNAETLHDNLDAWTPPDGVQVIQIAGWGVPTTVSGITYRKDGTGVEPDPQLTVDGDGTVVVPSALWTSAGTAENYWVNLRSYNFDHIVQTGFGLPFLVFEHSRILETDAVLDFLSDQVTNTPKILSNYTYISTQAPPSTDHRLRYALHSPLTLNLYDDQGRHTGISTTTGQVEEQIPGTYYMEFGEVKYVFTDASTTARIVMNGYAPGTFTFNIDEYAGDTLTASTTFKDIPTTASTTVSLDVQSDISTLSPMHIDTEGDGTIDHTLVPKPDGTVTLDTTPPEITITFATSTNSLAFIGTDDSGTTTIRFTTNYPNLKKNEKKPQGIATTTVTARDGAGNTTVLVYTETLPSLKQRDTITLQEIAYNGATTTIASTTLSYKWRQNKDGTYKLFASHLRTIATSTESHYRSKKDQTIIMTKPADLDDDERDDDTDIRPMKQILPGMVVPYMKTGEGRMIIRY